MPPQEGGAAGGGAVEVHGRELGAGLLFELEHRQVRGSRSPVTATLNFSGLALAESTTSFMLLCGLSLPTMNVKGSEAVKAMPAKFLRL